VVENSNLARDHLANERTFLAWVRTSVAVVVFGFAIGRFVMMVAGLARYRRTRAQLDEGKFEPAGFVVDLVAILTVLFGMALAGYLIYVQKSFG
jgi:putative membrane protein